MVDLVVFENTSEFNYQWDNCEILKVKSASGEYKVSFLDETHDFDRFIRDLNAVRKKDHLIFIVDECLKKHLNILNRPVLYLEANEEQKSYDGVGKVIEKLLEMGVTKDTHIVAIGGGVIQDTASFVASILFRGISWSFYPSTLLAQGDSCIGSKTSINFKKHKNQLGNFYPAESVWIHTKFLESLPELQIYSGLGEMLHYFFVASDERVEFFSKNIDNLKNLIRSALYIKSAYIEVDEFDKKERRVFNYGHSFGHALESVLSYEIPHGLAVCYGMDMANYVSMKFGYISKEQYNKYNSVLYRIYSKYELPDFDIGEFEKALKRDKKNKDDEYGLILTKGAGNMFLDYVKMNGDLMVFIKEWKKKL